MEDKTFLEQLKKYAELAIKIGLNVQKNDEVIITIAIDQATLAHLLVEQAYLAGARNVILQWQDEQKRRLDLTYQTETELKQVASFKNDLSHYIVDNRVKRLTVMSSDPQALADLDPRKISAAQSASSSGTRAVKMATENNWLSWTIIAAASPAWAQKVFPDENSETSTQHLWQEIFKAVRIDQEDPLKAWQQQKEKLIAKAKLLNQYQFDQLHYVAPDTDLTIGLPKNHIWEAASSLNKKGEEFIPNMPTEEVFTAPDAKRVNGYVRATRPLSYAGTVISGMAFTFERGHVIKVEAEQGLQLLKQLLKTDSGASMLGEVALVPNPSPISQSGITFFNTLFDENAANHLALGAAYPFSIAGGSKMNQLQLQLAGLNVSQIHVDFMIGSENMSIDGHTTDGQVVPIFRSGDWA
ncbi:aminopeptidase S [Lapidilactobacillus dextrinicus DSM 20335]|uniref:Aminopeptidase S n=1 Tax=Lapidilactobacillus dextrinicus DSM 20335 TaxID=1423738 RepID=A0A0R2BVV4_9LACO|nr:aminopeptidase [Lapidilactobacillus dextrinicus]KRM79996.1 aminopeptidase S [Lapidilactobacillus dextrinicus DSM 20335]QFG46230.1 aminopeptidase [Lapidilactobacillus dextrinicus]